MARIVVGSYLVRFPLGGYQSLVLQWLLAFQRLGHEVHFVEKAGWRNACFDPATGTMGDDCQAGAAVLAEMFERWALRGTWCFIDADGAAYGASRSAALELLRSADLFIDMGAHGAWAEETASTPLRILVDGEPGMTQMRMVAKLAAGETLPDYDHRYTVGRSIGTEHSSAPTASRAWRPIVWPVNVDIHAFEPPPPGAPFTTVMSWRVHEPIWFEGVRYGQKDIEMAKFMELPSLVDVPMELAITGPSPPIEALEAAGWRTRDAHGVSQTLDDYNDYIRRSRGEFGVAKNMFVATRSGWFSDRSAVYLASGRPVVVQETGFSRHLPCGQGLFAVNDPEEAADAIRRIELDYDVHSRAARAIAHEHLEARVVLGALLSELGVS